MSRYSRERRGPYHPGQDDAPNSTPPTTSTRPPRPAPQPTRGGHLTDDQARIAILEECLVAAHQLWLGQIKPTDPSYGYVVEGLEEEVEQIYASRPDFRRL